MYVDSLQKGGNFFDKPRYLTKICARKFV